MLDVCLLGTSGMMPLPGRHLTSLLLRHEGHSILVDCGEGTQVAIRKYAWSMHAIDCICFTHTHGDHVAGISGLLSTMGSEGRKEAVHIIGPATIEEVIAQICVVVAVPFQVIFHSVKEPDLQFAGMTITPFPVDHNITCFGYRFDIDRLPAFLPEKARQLEIPVQYWSKLQEGKGVRVGLKHFTPDQVRGPARRGISLVYATDTRPCRMLEDAAYDVDLLITEGIYADPDKQASAVEKKHMTSQEAALLAKRAGAHETWLTHYSPSFRNQKAYAAEIQAILPTVRFGRDGDRKTLLFPDQTEMEEKEK